MMQAETKQCLACRAANDPSDQRCIRCGRRLHHASPRPAPENYRIETATAPALQVLPGGAMLADEFAADYPSQQPSLFRDVLTGAKVIPIPTLTPLRIPGEHEPRRAQRRAGVRSIRRQQDSQVGFSQPAFSQQSLVFHDERNALAPLEETILCDAPVAAPPHRMLAAAVDASLVLVSVGLFLGIFFLSGGDLVLNRQTIPLLLCVVLLVTLFYRGLWCLADGDTPGMRFAGLRLVDFDGRRPGREHRAVRQIASLLSFVSAGLGLVWALVDEESLTWHDHISKTFPTAG